MCEGDMVGNHEVMGKGKSTNPVLNLILHNFVRIK